MSLICICCFPVVQRGAILSALQATSQSAAPSPHDTPGRSARTTAEQRSTSPSKSAATNAAAAAVPDAGLPADVKLPEHGGFVAHFVDAGQMTAWCGTR
jgi:hypothetical protein